MPGFVAGCSGCGGVDVCAGNTVWGATAGFLAGFGWTAMGIGIVSLFERKSRSYLLINGGYLTVALTVMNTILGAWR